MRIANTLLYGLSHLCAFIFTNWLENCSIVKIEYERKEHEQRVKKNQRG